MQPINLQEGNILDLQKKDKDCLNLTEECLITNVRSFIKILNGMEPR